ncbi:hypothetical protein FVR03_01205 [Pontibacter qinzhouensis]|uniref:Uncharacterized protein n=1 Tax=Pontibacter qinzhouensis TaxID=2603253 RepID=A0A5C8KDS0_9BACT|nr:hypothetical protein [Pontibacter qinzhouensis]TXK52361.1 hypothetical protein FVR03_01205 [Pontibacter qinzhouensis]
MAKNKLSDLNNHLFAQLERLNDDDLTADQVEKEIGRAKAISSIASQVIHSSKVTLEAMRLVASGDLREEELPDQFNHKRLQA